MPTKNHNFDSSGPDIRVRGNAYQVLEKYLQLARDAGTAGDRVAAENFLQHADHYYRVVASMNEGQRPRIGGREVSVADVNVHNVSQGLSAAMSGHGHSGGEDLPADNQQQGGHQSNPGNQGNQGNQGNGQMRSHASQGGGDSEQRPNADSGGAQASNGADQGSNGNSDQQGNFSAPDEQPDYPEDALPADAAGNNAPRDGGQPQDGRQQGRMGRGRRRGPGRRVRSEGEEASAPGEPQTTPSETQ